MVGKKQQDGVVVTPLPFDEIDNAALYGVPGEVVRLLEPSCETDSASLLIQFLALFGNAVSGTPVLSGRGNPVRGNLFVLVVGATGRSRKGTGYYLVIDNIIYPLFLRGGWRTHGGLASPEGIIKRWSDSGTLDRRAMIYQSEFGHVLTVSQRKGNPLTELLRQAFDGDRLENMSKSAPDIASNVYMSIIGQITREELMSKFDMVDYVNGYANRFLWFYARRTKILSSPPAIPTEALTVVLDKIKTASDAAKDISDVKLTGEAAYYWDLLYKEFAVERDRGIIDSVLERGPTLILRIALIYMLLDGVTSIDTRHLKAAVACYEYSERSVIYIFKDVVGTSIADTILIALRKKENAKGLTLTEISRLFNNNQRSADLQRELEQLQARGFAESIKNPTGGKPETRWRLVPQAMNRSQSTYLPIFDVKKPSRATLKQLEKTEAENAKIRAANDAVKNSYRSKFNKDALNEAKGEQTLKETAEKEAA